MANELSPVPKWVVRYSTKVGRWVSTHHEFFDNMDEAWSRANELEKQDPAPLPIRIIAFKWHHMKYLSIYHGDAHKYFNDVIKEKHNGKAE